MIGDDPTGKDSETMIPDALNRAATPAAPAESPWTRNVPPAELLTGRRISFAAWGLAGVAGIALWALFFKLV